ncbi:MAG: MBL fold metallo-hydrolase [Prevotella sp.]
MLNIKGFVCNFFQENCYVVSDETKQCVIIDCGAYYEEEKSAVVDYIRNNSLTLKYLLATHAHIDHNFGNPAIFTEFGVRPMVSAKDEVLMNHLARQSEMLCNIRLKEEMPPVGSFFDENTVISFGSHQFSVIPTPGHTPGSVFLYCKEENIAFSGDTLFKMSIGRTDLDFGSFADIQRSLDMLKRTLPMNTVIYPGHGGHTTLEDEVRHNPFLQDRL